MEIKEKQTENFDVLFFPQFNIEIVIKKNDYVEYEWDNGYGIVKFSTKQIIYDLLEETEDYKLKTTFKHAKTSYGAFKHAVQSLNHERKKKYEETFDPKNCWYDGEDGPPATVAKVVYYEIMTGKFKHISFINLK